MRDLNRRDDDERRQAIRQKVLEQDACRAEAEAMRRLDIFLMAFDEGGSAHRAREIGPLHEDQGEDYLPHALSEQGEHHEGDEDSGKAQHQVDDAHDERVEAAAGICRDQAEGRPEQPGRVQGHSRLLSQRSEVRGQRKNEPPRHREHREEDHGEERNHETHQTHERRQEEERIARQKVGTGPLLPLLLSFFVCLVCFVVPLFSPLSSLCSLYY